MSIKLDTTDRAILNILQTNSRTTIKEMAAQLNLSTTPTFEGVKKLEREKIITVEKDAWK